jgi:hypothetical protein
MFRYTERNYSLPAAKFTTQPNKYCAQLRETLPAAKGRKIGSRKFYNGIFVKFTDYNISLANCKQHQV